MVEGGVGGTSETGVVELELALRDDWEVAIAGVGGGGVRFLMARDSRVWGGFSSVGDWGGGIETVEYLESAISPS